MWCSTSICWYLTSFAVTNDVDDIKCQNAQSCFHVTPYFLKIKTYSTLGGNRCVVCDFFNLFLFLQGASLPTLIPFVSDCNFFLSTKKVFLFISIFVRVCTFSCMLMFWLKYASDLGNKRHNSDWNAIWKIISFHKFKPSHFIKYNVLLIRKADSIEKNEFETLGIAFINIWWQMP